MPITVYHRGGEDEAFFPIGGATVNTTAGRFRSTFTRCNLAVSQAGGIGSQWWQNQKAFDTTPTQFWWQARMWTNTNNSAVNFIPLRFLDAAGFVRFRLIIGSNGVGAPMLFQKVNTAGTATTLTNTMPTWAFLPSTTAPDLLTFYIDNAVAGEIRIYYNTTQVFAYTGDTTTETTGIAYVQFGANTTSTGCGWSEEICCDTDPRTFNLQTFAPVANGNTHDFDVGSPAAANVNEITLSDATLDGASAAGLSDQYTIPAIAAGSWSIPDVAISARCLAGAAGPQHFQFNVRVSGADYFTADQNPPLGAYENRQYGWTLDPATGLAWAALPTNIGLNSTA